MSFRNRSHSVFQSAVSASFSSNFTFFSGVFAAVSAVSYRFLSSGGIFAAAFASYFSSSGHMAPNLLSNSSTTAGGASASTTAGVSIFTVIPPPESLLMRPAAPLTLRPPYWMTIRFNNTGGPPKKKGKHVCIHCLLEHADCYRRRLCAYKDYGKRLPVFDNVEYRFETAEKLQAHHLEVHKNITGKICKKCGNTLSKHVECHVCFGDNNQQMICSCSNTSERDGYCSGHGKGVRPD